MIKRHTKMVHNATAQQVFFPYERNSGRNAYVQAGDQDITSVFLRLYDRSISKLPGGKELRRTNKRCLYSGDLSDNRQIQYRHKREPLENEKRRRQTRPPHTDMRGSQPSLAAPLPHSSTADL